MAGPTLEPAATDDAFRELVEAHQGAVRTHCYRLLGSLQDAEDLAQETLLRAWRKMETFEGRASMRAWLYSIATNACLDELSRRTRRVLPTMVGSPTARFEAGPPPMTETHWLEPFPDAWLEVPDAAPGPEARYEAKEAIELAFVAALQLLPPRQRAVLLLRDVLAWSAADVASLLDMSVVSANSALQRARAKLDTAVPARTPRLTTEAERALLERYVSAWEHSDVDALVALLKDDAVLSMPPLPEWYVGRAAISTFLRWVTSPAGGGPFRYVPTRANNAPAIGVYSGSRPFILQVLAVDAKGIAAMTSFMNPGLFKAFGLV
jgi:RNA polymerase sigma-70 factor (ECF subfamily)